MLAVKLTANYELPIPVEVREAMHLQPGQRFAVIPKGRTISLVPVPDLDELVGLAEGADTNGSRDHAADRLAQQGLVRAATSRKRSPM